MGVESSPLQAELVALDELRDHPRNYRRHPDDQLTHLKRSIQENGFYRNIVIASDNTILAGHGAVKAARELGYTEVPAIRLDIASDDPRALKVVIGDNEIEHLAQQDDRLLTELLKEIQTSEVADLLGTGYDEKMLAALLYVTRPAHEIADHNEAAHWVGMPEYAAGTPALQVVVSFKSEEDRAAFIEKLELDHTAFSHKNGKTWSMWYPPKEKVDLASVRFEDQL